ncbi:MAG: NUDIX domain-containing protein [Bacteroidia bacterium]|nr:NUDIX domain-containing protein [Bacteroidia bacterium]
MMFKTVSKINKLNVRVYGICINQGHLLLVRENINDIEIVKFPGGGLEFGEGLLDSLKREISEELNMKIKIINHFYTTDFFQKSYFYPNEQIISVYYLIDIINCPDINKFPIESYQNPTHKLSFFWIKPEQLNSDLLSLPIDKHVYLLLKKYIK